MANLGGSAGMDTMSGCCRNCAVCGVRVVCVRSPQDALAWHARRSPRHGPTRPRCSCCVHCGRGGGGRLWGVIARLRDNSHPYH